MSEAPVVYCPREDEENGMVQAYSHIPAHITRRKMLRIRFIPAPAVAAEPTLTLIGSGFVNVGKDDGVVTLVEESVPASARKVLIVAGHAIQYGYRGTTRGYYNEVERFSFVAQFNDYEEVGGQWSGDGLGSAANGKVTSDTVDSTNRCFGYIYGVS